MNDQFSQRRLVFLDVDTQVDFMLPEGSLYLEHATTIIPNLGKLLGAVARSGHLLLLAEDAHIEDDPEFSTYGFPPHCVKGTYGQKRIPETNIPATLTIANRPGGFSTPLGEHRVVRVEKQSFSFGSNPNFAALFAEIGPCQVIVSGVATEGCVQASILSLLDLNIPVSVVIDAVGHGRAERGELALENMASLGVSPISTDDVCTYLLNRN